MERTVTLAGMVAGDATLMTLVRAIVAADDATVSGLLAASPAVAGACVRVGATRQAAQQYFLAEVGHYLYAGDTPLHVAAAGYRSEMARSLVALGADVAASNRRGAQPLRYAADGVPGSINWDPDRQAETGVEGPAGGDPATAAKAWRKA